MSFSSGPSQSGYGAPQTAGNGGVYKPAAASGGGGAGISRQQDLAPSPVKSFLELGEGQLPKSCATVAVHSLY